MSSDLLWISEPMAHALEAVRKHKALERLKCGLWSFPGCTLSPSGQPSWAAQHATIKALIRRDYLVVTSWEKARPVRVEQRRVTR